MEYSSFFIVLIYFSAKLTKVCRYKDFHLFIFPSANIIVRAKALKNRVFTRLLPLQGALLIAIIPRAMPWARSFWAFSPYLSHMRKFSKAKVMRCFCRRETFQGYPSLLAMPIAHSGISFTYSLNILPSVILKRS